MAKQRKLFITHAGELAHRLVRAVRPHGMIADFASSYARKHHRVGVVDEPNRLHELEETLGREAILIMVAEVLRLMPSALGAHKKKTPSPEEAAFSRMFFSEFMTALTRALEWPADDFDSEQADFDRDLLMYRRWFERGLALDDGGSREGISPFLDRCALLLDPSTMEEAREAAGTFEKVLAAEASRIFAQLGRAGTERHQPAAPRKTRHAVVRKPKPRPKGKVRIRTAKTKKSAKESSGARKTRPGKNRRK
jgi:hypothetical protein